MNQKVIMHLNVLYSKLTSADAKVIIKNHILMSQKNGQFK